MERELRPLLFCGGSAMAVLVEEAARRCDVVRVVVPVTDDGGSTGVLLDRWGGTAVGDLRKLLVRLGRKKSRVGGFLNYRLGRVNAAQEFQDVLLMQHAAWHGLYGVERDILWCLLSAFAEKLACDPPAGDAGREGSAAAADAETFSYEDASLGNLVLCGGAHLFGSLEASLTIVSVILGVSPYHSVIPNFAVREPECLRLAVELANGDVIVGQNDISHPSVVECARARAPSNSSLSASSSSSTGTVRFVDKDAAHAALPSFVAKLRFLDRHGSVVRPRLHPALSAFLRPPSHPTGGGMRVRARPFLATAPPAVPAALPPAACGHEDDERVTMWDHAPMVEVGPDSSSSPCSICGIPQRPPPPPTSPLWCGIDAIAAHTSKAAATAPAAAAAAAADVAIAPRARDRIVRDLNMVLRHVRGAYGGVAPASSTPAAAAAAARAPPPPAAATGAVRTDVNLIVYGRGSFFTSLLPCLAGSPELTSQIVALRHVPKVWIVNCSYDRETTYLDAAGVLRRMTAEAMLMTVLSVAGVPPHHYHKYVTHVVAPIGGEIIVGDAFQRRFPLLEVAYVPATADPSSGKTRYSDDALFRYLRTLRSGPVASL